MQRVLVVGASLAGLSTVTSLRREGHDGPITLVGAETDPPYDRPPLSKSVLFGDTTIEDHIFFPREHFTDDLGVDLRLGVPAVALDSDGHTVTVGDDELPYDKLVVATGSRARWLPGAEGIEGVQVLRDAADSRRLARTLEERSGPVVVVGAGFIGAEVAAAAHRRGHPVTILEAAEAPMERAVGADLGTRLGNLHAAHGVDLRTGVMVEGFESDGRVEGIRLAGGEVVPADLVVVGVGVAPNVEWLDENGFDLTNGVLTDETLRVAPDIYAAGDVARFPSQFHRGKPVRIEHWTNAQKQGMAVAKNLLGAERPFVDVPSFWSDQYESNIQLTGTVSDVDEIEILSDDGQGRVVALSRIGDELAGVLVVDAPKVVPKLRRGLMAGMSYKEARVVALEMLNA